MEMTRAFLRVGVEFLLKRRGDRRARLRGPRGASRRVPLAAATAVPSLNTRLFDVFIVSTGSRQAVQQNTGPQKVPSRVLHSEISVFFGILEGRNENEISCFIINLQLMVREVKKCIEDRTCRPLRAGCQF